MIGRRLSDQRGSAVIAALAVMTLGLLLGSVAITRSLASNRQADRGTAVRQAQQAADAGLQIAIDRMNRLEVDQGLLPCVASASGGVLSLGGYDVALGGQWCPAVTETLADGREYSYRVSAAVQITGAQVTLDRTVVSTGTSGRVTRRVARRRPR